MKLLKTSTMMLALLFITTSVSAQNMIKPDTMVKDEAFAKSTSLQKLEKINQMAIEKKLSSSDYSDFTARLISEELAPIADAKGKLDKYGQLRKQFDKLSTNYDLEKTLILQYLASDPTASTADIVTKMKLVTDLKETNVISWPGVADISTGLLTYHLATDAEFQKKTIADKILYIRDLETRKVITSLTSADFLRGLTMGHLSTVPADKRKEELMKLKSTTGFFAESSLGRAYIDLVQP